MDKDIVVRCPNCDDLILIEQINCSIFRHGVHKDSFTQLNPHATKEECDNAKVWGCAKPFRLVKVEDFYIAVKCQYI